MFISRVCSVCGMALLVYCVANRHSPYAPYLFTAGILFMCVFFFLRCPRCAAHVIFSGDGIAWLNVDHCCVKCGRARRGIWPFQFIFAREKWDGKFRSECQSAEESDS